MLAVDTEFVRTNTYYAQLGLVQIATRDQIFLIDPIPLGEQGVAIIGEILLSSERQIVMHSAGEDFDIFYRLWQGLPPHFFDTQIAAGFVGYDRQSGLQRLLKDAMDIELAKDAIRSDWLQRPLSEKQLQYAAADVAYLLPLADRLQTQLEQQERTDWVSQECQLLIDKYVNKPTDDRLYLNYSSGWRFSGAKQAALQQLLIWREQTAREKNIPKTFIAKDANLLQIVDKGVNHKKGLADVGLSHSQIRRFGDGLLAQVQQGLANPAPEPAIARPLTKGQQKRYKQLKQWVLKRAEALALPADLLASKAQLCDYLVARENGQLEKDSPFLHNWREQELQSFLDQQVYPTQLEPDAG